MTEREDMEEYFRTRVRAAMTEYFEGDTQKVDAMMEFLEAKAQEFKS